MYEIKKKWTSFFDKNKGNPFKYITCKNVAQSSQIVVAPLPPFSNGLLLSVQKSQTMSDSQSTNISTNND